MMTLSAAPARMRRPSRAGMVAAAVLLLALPGAARAQEGTVVVGRSHADPVTVDLSVLDQGGGYLGSRDDLLFPGSRHKPGQRIILSPPGTFAKAPVLTPPGRGRARPPARAIARSPAPPPPPAIAMQAPRRAPRPAPVAAPPTPPAPPPIAAIKPAAGPGPAVKAETPALAPPAIRKRAPKSAPQASAIPPVPAPPKAPPARAAAPVPDVPPPPPPPVPRVEAAPRTPVLSADAAKQAPKASARSAADTQVAAIPRGGAIASGATRQITFAPASAILEAEGKSTIGAIALALAKNPALRVELKAYAPGTPENVSQARRLSLSRALAIRSELMRQGVKPTRIDVRALGNRVPGGSPDRADLLVFTR